VAGQDFPRQVLVLSTIAVVMTVGVYGLVAGIVKLDDAGLYLSQRRDALQQALGRSMLRAGRGRWLAERRFAQRPLRVGGRRPGADGGGEE